MAISQSEVLIEIVTAANLAGIEQAKASLLGFSPATLGLAAAIGAGVVVGRAAVENYEAQTEATNNLNNAIKDRNALQADDPKAIAGVQKAQETLAKAQQALGLEEDRLSSKRKLTKADLDELKIKNDAVTKAQNDLAAASAKVSESHNTQRYDSAVLQQQVRDFIGTNRDFIDNQYDAVNGFAAFVREGVPAKDLTKAMTAAVDISASEHISLAQAVDLIQSAESGRATGLKKLVGIQLESVSATATEADKAKTAAANLNLVAKAYDGAHNNLTPLQRKQNDLNNDWQHFTADIGPGVTTTLEGITTAADLAVVGIDNLQNALQAWGGSPGVNAAVGDFQTFIMGTPLAQQLAAIHAASSGANRNSTGGVNAPSYTNSGLNPIGGRSVVVNVNGANQTNDQVGSAIVRQLRRIGVI